MVPFLGAGHITDASTLTFDRDQTGQSMNLTWYLVEFTDGTTVQHASQAFTSTETFKDVSLSAVDLTRSIAVGGYTMQGGKSATTSATPGAGWFTLDLTNATTLRLTRALTGSTTADIGWFVVNFIGPASASAVTSTMTASPTSITADGVSTSAVTVQLKDSNGNDLTAGGDAVTLATTLGTLGAVTDNGDGSYTATLTSATTAGTAAVTGTVNTVAITDNAAVTFMAGVPVALAFAVEPSNTLAGATINPVKVEPVDTNGNRVAGYSGSVTLLIEDNPGGGTLLGPTSGAVTSGMATFSGLSIDQEGTGYTLRATSAGFASAVSAAFDILSSKVDLEVRMIVSEASPAEGDTIVYTITVTNDGSRTATGVEITDELPSRVSIISSSVTKGSFNSTTGVWEVGTLAEGASATLSITVTVNGPPTGST